MRDDDPFLAMDEDRPEVQIYVVKDGQNYEEFDQGLFRMVERYDGGQETCDIEIRRPFTEELIIASVLKKESNFERQQAMVITWHDTDQLLLKEVGISFLDRATCDCYWKKICKKLNLDLFSFSGAGKLQMPAPENFDTFLATIRKDLDLINHYLLYSESFRQALWNTFESLRRSHDENKIDNFIKILLQYPDKSILEALIEGPNFQHFLKLFRGKITSDSTLDLFAAYRQSTTFGHFIELPAGLQAQVELIERIRFLKIHVLVPGENNEMEKELDRLSEKARVHFIEQFIKQQVCSKSVEFIKQTIQQGIQSEIENACSKFHQFYSEFFITFVPIDDPKLKSRIFKDLLHSGLLEIGATIIRLNKNFKILQLFFNLVNDDEALFNTLYFEDLEQHQNQSLHATVCYSLMNSEEQDVADECLVFFQGFADCMRKNPMNLAPFIRVSLPTIFSGQHQFPERILSLICLCIKSFDELEGIGQQVVSSDFYNTLMGGLRTQRFPKHVMVDIVFILKATLMTYGNYFVNFRTHLLSSQSFEKELSDYHPSFYKRPRKYYDSLAEYSVTSGLLAYFLDYLKAHIRTNNMLNSAILSLIRTSTVPMQYNPILKAIREHDFDLGVGSHSNASMRVLSQCLHKIRRVQIPTHPSAYIQGPDLVRMKAYEQQLESEREEKYLLRDIDGDRNEAEPDSQYQRADIGRLGQKSEEEKMLLKMRQEIRKSREEQERQNLLSSPCKKVKREEDKAEKRGHQGPLLLTFQFARQ